MSITLRALVSLVSIISVLSACFEHRARGKNEEYRRKVFAKLDEAIQETAKSLGLEDLRGELIG
jgi:hypothetical protein